MHNTNAPTASPALNETFLWSLARVAPPAVAGDGSFLVVPVKTTNAGTGKSQTILYKIIEGFEPVALTSPGTTSTGPSISPDQRWLAFLRKPREEDDQRETFAQLHLLDLKHGGEARVVGHFPLGISDVRWFADSKRLCVVASVIDEAPTLTGTKQLLETRAKDRANVHVTESRFVRYWDHYVTDGEIQHLFELSLDDDTTRDLTPSLKAWFDLDGADGMLDLSPNGELIAFSAHVSDNDHANFRYNVFLLSVRDQSLKSIGDGYKGDAVRPRFSPDGKSIVYGAKNAVYYGTNSVLILHSLADHSERALTAHWDHSAEEWEFAGPSAIVGITAHHARSLPFRLEISSTSGDSKIQFLHTEGSAHGLQLSRDGRLYFTHDNLRRPAEIARLSAQGGPLTYLTRFNDEAMSAIEFGAIEERFITGTHGDNVQYWLVHPPASMKASRGLVQVVHGGPCGTFGDTWHWRWNAQLFAARGYTVCMVNFHGSNSFGESFARSVLDDWGGAPAKDIELVTDALIKEGIAQPGRLAVAGGSYGGYMAAWLVTQTQRYSCAVAHAAVTNFMGMFGGDVPQVWEEEMGAWPWNDAKRFFKHDPMHHVGNVRTPVLVVHGEKDYRVPYGQGLDFYGALKELGVSARLVMFPQENHWILQRDNSIKWFQEVFGWLDRHMTANAPAT